MNLQQIKKLLNSKASEVFEKLGMNCEVLGDNIYSTCPIHDHSDNPRAFSYCSNRGIWKCWTRECQNDYRNDILGLIHGVLAKDEEDVDFNAVLKWINKEFGIRQNKNTKTPIIENVDEFQDLIKHLNDTTLFPIHKPIDTEICVEIPSRYFMNRGFSKQTLEYFEVGDCYDKKSKLFERAIIPVYSDDGSHKIAYICRSLKEYKLPKFLIYPKGFDKRFELYNLNKALPHIKESNCLFIVEGQGDLWKLHEAGVYNAVGMFGRTLSKEQQKKLQTLPITHIIILTDNDQAGRESKIQLQRQLGRFYKLSFPYLQHKDIGDMSPQQIKDNILSQVKV